MNKISSAAVDEAAVESDVNGAKGDRNPPLMLDWLKDAGFGLFIHWSVDVQLGCVISHSLVGSSPEYARRYYEELPSTFMPARWDAERMARLAKLAGARYAVFTAKHHNGFCMWDTRTTDFSVASTPYGRDIVAQYVEAFRKYGLKVGLYFSPEDFLFLRSHGLPITRTPTEPYPAEVMAEYRLYLRRQLSELLTDYGPIDLIFFDGGELMHNERGESLQEMCKNLAWDLQSGILVTRGAIKTPEQRLPGVGMKETWEACVTLSTAWGFQPTNDRLKTGEEVIGLLTRTRAMGGALLLNVGPDSDGALSAEHEGVLREVGLWNFINREAISDVRPWILAREGDIWLLADKAGTTVYAVITGQKDWDRGTRREFTLRSVRATARSEASVLGASGDLTEYRPDLDARCYLRQEPDGLRVSAMNAQRVYCGTQWRNPPVIRVTNVEPAFTPMAVETAAELVAQSAGGARLRANVLSLGSFARAEVGFYWREYPGFAMAAREDGWLTSESVPVAAEGAVDIELSGLKRGTVYQYQAFIGNDMNNMRGETALFAKE